MKIGSSLSAILLLVSALSVSGDDNIHTPHLIQISFRTNGIELKWVCPLTEDLQMFEIERESFGTNRVFTLNPFKLQQQQPAGSSSSFVWTDTNVVSGVLYLYTVTAHSISQESPPSNALEGWYNSNTPGRFSRGLKPVAQPKSGPIPLPPRE
jgi:hypothetical protein